MPPDAAGRNLSVNDGAIATDEALLHRIALCFAAHHAIKVDDVGGEILGMGQFSPGLLHELFAPDAKDVAQALVDLDPALGG